MHLRSNDCWHEAGRYAVLKPKTQQLAPGVSYAGPDFVRKTSAAQKVLESRVGVQFTENDYGKVRMSALGQQLLFYLGSLGWRLSARS